MTYLVNNWGNLKYFSLLFLFYSIAHGGILFIPNAIYWDDWTLYQVDPNIIFDNFQHAGSMFNITGYLHNFFLKIGPWLYRVITFILMFFAGFFLDVIIKKQKILSTEARFFIVLLFLVLPFYWARVALIDAVYTISYFLFFFAWSIMDRYRALSLLLFFLSFNTNSLLIFYALPFLDYYYRSVNGEISIKSALIFGVRNISFLLLPFIYFSIKITFYAPYGLYEGYNEQYNILNLLISPTLMFLDWLKIETSVIALFFLALLFITILPLLITLSDRVKKRSAIIIFLWGLLAITLGGIPYWILGHVPTFSEWTSRHQLLLPLGAALLLVSFLVLINSQLRLVSISLFLSMSMVLNLRTYCDFYFDWQKQKDLIALMSENKLIQDTDLVVFDDRASSFNAINRTYRSYEWNGLLASAFGDESRFGLHQHELIKFENGNIFKGYFSHGEKYRNADFKLDKDLETVLVRILPSGTSIQSVLSNRPLVSIDVMKLPKTTLSLK